jgi:hypothetical protein
MNVLLHIPGFSSLVNQKWSTIVFLGLEISTSLSHLHFTWGTVDANLCINFHLKPYKMASTTLSTTISSTISAHSLIPMSYLKAASVQIHVQLLPRHSLPCSSLQVAFIPHGAQQIIIPPTVCTAIHDRFSILYIAHDRFSILYLASVTPIYTTCSSQTWDSNFPSYFTK